MTSLEDIPFLTFGSGKETIHFAHANAYPPGSYRELLTKLGENHSVLASKARPLWQESPSAKDTSWTVFADDLIRFLDNKQLSGIIGIGHSLGAVMTLIAAIKRPDLFRKIILLEPVLLHRNLYWLTGIIPLKMRRLIVPPIQIAEKRRNFWQSKEEAFKSFRTKKVFSKFSDTALKNYITAGLTKTEGGFKLIFSPEWEARVYAMAYSSWKIYGHLSIPSLSIRAEETNAIYKTAWPEWKKLRPEAEYLTMQNTTHLLPLEVPNELSTILHQFIQNG
ncbi:MAG: alpha/beta hydrolase [Calditrichota bacterium]